MKMRVFPSALLMTALFLLPATVHADTLRLKNGDRLTGHYSGMSGLGVVRFQTDYAQLTIPVASIASLTDTQNRPITLPQAAAGTPGYMTPVERSARIRAQQQQQKPQPAQTAAIAASPATAASEGAAKETGDTTATGLWGADWRGRVNIGASLQSGNSETTAINADAETQAKWEDHRVTATAEYNYEEDGGSRTVDDRAAGLMYDYFYTEKWFLNTRAGLEQDQIANLDLRTTIGAGIGHQFYESDALNLKAVLGAAYLHEEFGDDTSDDSLAATWALDYDQKFAEGLFQLFHNHELFVPTDDAHAYLLQSKTGIRVPLKMGLVGTAAVDYDWDNDPPAGTEEEDVIYSLKLGYEW